MNYSNNNPEPHSQLPRVITINIDDPAFSNCSINLNVINTPDKPVVHLMEGYIASYTEDSGAVAVTNTFINITDEDNYLLYVAIIWLNNTVEGVNDRLLLPESFSTNFTIAGNGTTTINATAKSFTLSHQDFIGLLQGIFFQTDDQATNITRQLFFTVEEIPLGEAGPSEPVMVPIRMIPLNDRPVLTGHPFLTAATLNDYLPPESKNPGFFPSLLVNSSVVSDPDSTFSLAADIIGLAVFTTDSGGVGEWQYWKDGQWLVVQAVTQCNPLFLSDTQRIRFLPTPSSSKTSGSASFQYWVWDGKSEDICTGGSLRTDEGEKQGSR